jgi:hypothetical protein
MTSSSSRGMSSANMIERLTPEILPQNRKKKLKQEQVAILAPIYVKNSGLFFGEIEPGRTSTS